MSAFIDLTSQFKVLMVNKKRRVQANGALVKGRAASFQGKVSFLESSTAVIKFAS